MKNMKSKHAKKSDKKIIFILIFIVIVLILVAFSILSKSHNNSNNIIENTEPENIIENTVTEVPEEQFEIVDISDLPDTYKGYTVIGKIVIDKIGVEQKILSETNNNSLKYGVTKYWGPDLNEVRKCMFNRA